MAFYANQHTGTIKKKIDKSGGKPFMQISIEEIQDAAKTLNPSALKLYLYLAQNQDEYEFSYSPKDFQNAYNVSESTAKRAKTELIDKGYIVYDSDKHFYFFTNRKDGSMTLEEVKEQLNEMMHKLVELGLTPEEELQIKDKAILINQVSKDELEKVQRAKSLLKELKKEYNKRRAKDTYFDFL